MKRADRERLLEESELVRAAIEAGFPVQRVSGCAHEPMAHKSAAPKHEQRDAFNSEIVRWSRLGGGVYLRRSEDWGSSDKADSRYRAKQRLKGERDAIQGEDLL